MKQNIETLTLYTPQKEKAVAHVVLNGYNIHAGGPLGAQGAMRSFTIVTGDLWDSWSVQQPLLLRDDLGKEAVIRIAALPVEEDGYGLIEFL